MPVWVYKHGKQKAGVSALSSNLFVCGKHEHVVVSSVRLTVRTITSFFVTRDESHGERFLPPAALKKNLVSLSVLSDDGVYTVAMVIIQ